MDSDSSVGRGWIATVLKGWNVFIWVESVCNGLRCCESLSEWIVCMPKGDG